MDEENKNEKTVVGVTPTVAAPVVVVASPSSSPKPSMPELPRLYVTEAALSEMTAEVLAHADRETAWGLYGFIYPKSVYLVGVIRPTKAEVVRGYANAEAGGRDMANAMHWLHANNVLVQKTVDPKHHQSGRFAFLFKGHSHHTLGYEQYSGTDQTSIYEAVAKDGMPIAIGPLALIKSNGTNFNHSFPWGSEVIVSRHSRVGFLFYMMTREMIDVGYNEAVIVRPTIVQTVNTLLVPPLGWEFARDDEFKEQVRHMESWGFTVKINHIDANGKPPLEIQFVIDHSSFRATVFITTDWNYPEVVYPKPALPMKVLPDELLEQFEKTFEKGWRGEFPLRLLDLRWTKCPRCGTEHARSSCPNCMTVVPKPLTIVKGNVTATYVFRANGTIMFATFQSGRLRYLYNDAGKYKREDGRVVLNGDPDPLIRYRISGEKTILAKSGSMATVDNTGAIDQVTVDSYGSLPLIDANGDHRYWVSGGILKREGSLGPEDIGAVLQNQTLFWVGNTFGFGFYRAGNMIVGFVFDKDRLGINDSVKLLPMRGQLIDSTCAFARDRCWFFTSNKEGSRTINRVTVVNKDGTVEARAEADDGDGSWLGKIRGKLAMGNFLLSPTDNGIVRVEPDTNGNISVVQEFPDTEPYVDGESYLLPAENGIFVVGRKEIVLLQIK